MQAKILLGSVLFFVVHVTAYADDNPDVVIGSQELHNLSCIDDATQKCINDICLTSEKIDCQSDCKTMAKDKCQEESDE